MKHFALRTPSAMITVGTKIAPLAVRTVPKVAKVARAAKGIAVTNYLYSMGIDLVAGATVASLRHMNDPEAEFEFEVFAKRTGEFLLGANAYAAGSSTMLLGVPLAAVGMAAYSVYTVGVGCPTYVAVRLMSDEADSKEKASSAFAKVMRPADAVLPLFTYVWSTGVKISSVGYRLRSRVLPEGPVLTLRNEVRQARVAREWARQVRAEEARIAAEVGPWTDVPAELEDPIANDGIAKAKEELDKAGQNGRIVVAEMSTDDQPGTGRTSRERHAEAVAKGGKTKVQIEIDLTKVADAPTQYGRDLYFQLMKESGLAPRQFRDELVDTLKGVGVSNTDALKVKAGFDSAETTGRRH